MNVHGSESGDAPVAPRYEQRVLGCLLGGALGDALGAPVEFLTLPRIREEFGPDGVREMEPAYGRVGAITDDTQMTLFTAEGLIRAEQRGRERGLCDPYTVLQHAYWRWLHTQGYGWDEFPHDGAKIGGWLIEQRVLHERRAPGNTCVSALLDASSFPAANDSKGCGGVMRMAPVGLSHSADPFELACGFAAITHGHSTGQVAAGVFAAIIRELMGGTALPSAVKVALRRLGEAPRAAETRQALEAALSLASSKAEHPPSPEIVESLGQGWVAEEALAIGVYAALVADDIRDGLCISANHGGDSDSTGSITGNLLGTWWGAEALPADWLEQLEARDIIERLAHDFANCFGRERETLDWDDYPPW